jgi:hypothetical protein
MSQPEESREKTGKTDATMDRRQAPSASMADGGEAVDNTAALNEARRRTDQQASRRRK